MWLGENGHLEPAAQQDASFDPAAANRTSDDQA